VAAGGFHSLLLTADGKVWSWGNNTAGQLGRPVAEALPPAEVAGLPKVTRIAAGTYHSLALAEDGSVWAWGRRLANGHHADSATPARIDLPGKAIAIAAGAEHALALGNDGQIMSWGGNAAGQLGNGTFSASARAQPVVDEQANGYLDLLPDAANDPAKDILPYFIKAVKNGYDLAVTVSDLRAAGLIGDVYFSALLPANSPLIVSPSPSRAYKSLPANSNNHMVTGVFSRGGFKQSSSKEPAEPAFSGDLSKASETPVFVSQSSDPLSNSKAVICMGVTVPALSAKGQVLMRPIATGTDVEGVVQCPPVQTASTIQNFSVRASGPLNARTILADIVPPEEDRGQPRQLFSWAVAPDGRQVMQTGPNQWAPMAEPMQPADSLIIPANGPVTLPAVELHDLSSLVGTLVNIGIGQSWEEVKTLNKASHYYTVE
jgi:hypothetical protein